MTTIINRRVCLEPKYLDSDVMSHLLNKLVDSTRDECSRENGYILGVKEIVSVDSTKISPANSDVVFSVNFKAEILKPIDGKTLEGEVCMVFRDGIFVDVKNKLKVLIPLSELSGYELNKSSTGYVKGNSNIQKGDTVKVMITGTKYSQQRFSCFGSLIEK